MLSPAPEGNVEILALKTNRYICQNPACRKGFESSRDPGFGKTANPKCSCGSETKKVYSKPTLTALKLSEAEARGFRESGELPAPFRS